VMKIVLWGVGADMDVEAIMSSTDRPQLRWRAGLPFSHIYTYTDCGSGMSGR
jgi:hypothetical protein